MEARQSCKDAPPVEARADHALWLLALVALLAWQTWATLCLFDRDRPLDRLLDDQPILSGRHPLHQYHGFLGARTFLQHGGVSCYDPAFHAGYPKTPIFDSGSRPAELLLMLAGGRFCPAAYKLGLAIPAALLPLGFWLAARGLGLTRFGSLLAALFALFVWWGGPCREMFLAGDVDLLIAAMMLVVQFGLLIRYHEYPGPLSLFGVVLMGFLGWFAHPLLMTLLLPVFLLYYLRAGVRHTLAWHCSLLGGLIAAIAANAFWLLDWINYLWIRVPFRLDGPDLDGRALAAMWNAPLWGDACDRRVALVLLAAAGVGVLHCNKTGKRPAAYLFGAAVLLLPVLALLSAVWPLLSAFGTGRLMVPALLLAVLPATHALLAAVRAGRRLSRNAGGAVAVTGLVLPVALIAWPLNRTGAIPSLHVGLDATQHELVHQLTAHTTAQARILWEDRRTPRDTPRWTALLPLLTERSYLGGLDPDAGIEHTVTGLCDQALLGKPLREWSNSQLADYCEHYNIGWVVCWTPGSVQRLQSWPAARQTAVLHDQEQEGVLFTIQRRYSFALTGSAEWLHADPQRIVLGDVTPERGRVVLSLHYQSGLRVTPGRVRIEPELDRDDPIPFVRLLLDEPVARVTVTWSRR
jgi:hypothetical protein